MKFFKSCLVFLLTSATVAYAEFPDKTIKVIVPYGSGSVSPAVRAVATGMSAFLKVPVVVENLPGAAGAIGAGRVAKSAADGYTLLFGGEAILVQNSFFYPNLPYDPVKDFTPVTLAFKTGVFLMVSKSLGVKTVQELVAMAKANPGKLTYASLGNGTSQNIAGELFKKRAGVDIQHIPYKTSASALTDILGGRISMTFYTYASVEGQIKAGNLIPLAYSDKERLQVVPEIPTLAESGFPGYELTVWFGYFAPAGTPKDVVMKLNVAIHDAMKTQHESLKPLYDFVPVPGSPEQLGDVVRDGTEKFRKQLVDLNLKFE